MNRRKLASHGKFCPPLSTDFGGCACRGDSDTRIRTSFMEASRSCLSFVSQCSFSAAELRSSIQNYHSTPDEAFEIRIPPCTNAESSLLCAVELSRLPPMITYHHRLRVFWERGGQIFLNLSLSASTNSTSIMFVFSGSNLPCC